MDEDEKTNEKAKAVASDPRQRRRRRLQHAQLLFTIAQAAKMLGQTEAALRRTIERHMHEEGEELVARLNHGVVARRRKDLARWSVHVPPALFG